MSTASPTDTASTESSSVSTESSVTEQSSVEQSSAEQSSVEQSSAEQSSAEQSSAEQSSVEQDEDIDYNLILELGDKVVVKSEKYGEVVGLIYYRSAERISILPVGLTNTLISFARTEEDDFLPEDGVTETVILKKHLYDTFVKQQDFRVGQILQGVDKEGAKGASYTVLSINEEEDSMVVQEESGQSIPLEFSGVGIPEDVPFVILRLMGLVKTEGEAAEAAAAAVTAEAEEEEEGEEGEEGEEEEGEPQVVIQVLGQVSVPLYEELEEIKAAKQVIPDTLQKISAINDFINIYEPHLQKDPRILRRNRILVETLFKMKQDIIAFRDDGTIKGLKPVTVHTLMELLEKTDVPLGRHVLDMRKRLYKLTGRKELTSFHEPTVKGGETEVFIKPFYDELKAVIANQSATVSTIVVGDQQKHIPTYLQEQKDYQAYERPWIPSDREATRVVRARRDMDVFRSILPDMDARTLDGNVPGPVLDYVQYGMERALKTTYRKSTKEDLYATGSRKQALLSAEGATALFYLLFPLSVASSLGTTRTGSLALDAGRSRVKTQSIPKIFKALGGIQDVATPQTIVAIGITGNTMGNIGIAQYLEGVSIPALGIGDTHIPLADLGLDQVDVTTETLTVLQTKISAYQAQLLTTIRVLREGVPKEDVLPTPNPMIPLDNPIFSDLPRSEPILAEDLVEFTTYNPTLASSDVATFAYLLQKHGDLFQAVLGQTSLYVATERSKAVRLFHLHAILKEQRILQNEADRGLPPKPNYCEHVANLRDIRKLENEAERMTWMVKFIAHYQGGRDGNWINCRLCKQHLLCVHERLLIQAFLNSNENELIQKEIILNFAGGIFQGNYSCRNCGQPIREIEYDTNLQYDESGKPMMGRAALTDEAFVREDELDRIIAIPLQEESTLFTNTIDKGYYNIVKELSERLGIALSSEGFKKIVRQVSDLVKSLPSKDAFAEREAQRKEAAEAARKKFVPRSYTRILARNTICSAAMFLFLDIQTAIPDYRVHHTLPNCKPGFQGFPLSGTKDDVQGLTYVACAVATVTRRVAPWTQTEFQEGKTLDDRIYAIRLLMMDMLDKTLAESLTLKQDIAAKLTYLKDLNDKKPRKDIEGANVDVIPEGFLPSMVVPLGAEQAATEEGAIVPEVAVNTPRQAARAWIRQSNQYAKETVERSRNLLNIEVTCCTTNIQDPGSFWNKEGLPALPIRSLQPRILVRAQQVSFVPRISDQLSGTFPAVEELKDVSYRLYLNVCASGPNKGRPHEPGLTYKCYLCGFEFGENPRVLDHDEGKLAVERQELGTTPEEFAALLDDVNRHNQVVIKHPSPPVKWDVTIEAFLTMDPPPVEDWETLLRTTLTELKRISSGSGSPLNVGDVAIANADLSVAVQEHEQAIIRSLRGNVKSVQTTMDNLGILARLPWNNFVEVLEIYFIVPFKKIVTGFTEADVPLSSKNLTKKFSPAHLEALNKMLAADNIIFNFFYPSKLNQTCPFALSKLSQFVDQMSVIVSFKNRIQRRYFVSDTTFDYIQQLLVYGPIKALFDADDVPEETFQAFAALVPRQDDQEQEEGEQPPVQSVEQQDVTLKYLIQLVGMSINNFKKQQLSYNEEELRTLIHARNEMEAIDIVNKYVQMSDEERAIDTVNRRLGIGEKWSVGGTKVIWQYDADHYDREVEERAAAGIGGGDYDTYGVDMGEGGYDQGGNNPYDDDGGEGGGGD